jgi:hypothetical protein
MWAATSGAHPVGMANTWFMTEHLVEDHRAALESAADRQRLVRSSRSADGRTRGFGGHRLSRQPTLASLQHRAA